MSSWQDVADEPPKRRPHQERPMLKVTENTAVMEPSSEIEALMMSAPGIDALPPPEGGFSDMMDEALQRLPERERDAVVTYVSGHSMASGAHWLGISKTEFYRRYQSGIAKLKSDLTSSEVEVHSGSEVGQ